jgi:hypothetical protein
MPRWLAGCFGAACLSSGILAQPTSVEPVAVEPIIARAAAYVEQFVERFSNVVAEERYSQDAVGPPRSGTPGPRGSFGSGGSGTVRRRELWSDFLMVKLPDSPDWVPFRDVFMVDGVGVRDREERLTRLFLQPAATALEQSAKIAADSARYNIGSVSRTINNPLIALALMQASHRPRFEFALGKADRSAGARIWIVTFRETSRPTLVRGAYDRDLPAHGRYWIDVDSGRIARTELIFDDPGASARITTSFRHDDRFGMDVPYEMREQYILNDGSRVTGFARYGRFRQFEVRTDEAVTPVR